jgi:hypothetical protein
MRLTSLLCIWVAASLLIGAAAHAANDVSIRIGDWILRPHFSEQRDKKPKDRRLDRCSAQLTNADKITMIYSLDTHYLWTFELSNPSWNFPSGSKFDVSFGNRERGFFRQRVAALDPQLVRVLLPDSVNSFEVFRRLFKLDVVAGGLTTQFDLAYANQVLLALTQCVTKFGTTAKSKDRGRGLAQVADRSGGRGKLGSRDPERGGRPCKRDRCRRRNRQGRRAQAR